MGSVTPITRYRRAQKKMAEAKATLEATRHLVITSGCPHDDVDPLTNSIYRGGTTIRIRIGDICKICSRARSAFGTEWKSGEEAQTENIDKCPHLETWHVEHRWHHGYGKYINGVECGNCKARKSFPSQGYWNTYAEWSTWKNIRDDD